MQTRSKQHSNMKLYYHNTTKLLRDLPLLGKATTDFWNARIHTIEAIRTMLIACKKLNPIETQLLIHCFNNENMLYLIACFLEQRMFEEEGDYMCNLICDIISKTVSTFSKGFNLFSLSFPLTGSIS